jgi:hypothetical protein
LNAATFGADVADADEEGTEPAIFDDAREVSGPVVTKTDWAADRPQREVLVDRKRACPGTTAAPAWEPRLPQRRPAPRFIVQRRRPQHHHWEPTVWIDPVRKAASAVDLDHELDAAAGVLEQDVGAGAVGQPRVDLDRSGRRRERAPGLLAADLATPKQLGRLDLTIEPGPEYPPERSFDGRHMRSRNRQSASLTTWWCDNPVNKNSVFFRGRLFRAEIANRSQIHDAVRSLAPEMSAWRTGVGSLGGAQNFVYALNDTRRVAVSAIRYTTR